MEFVDIRLAWRKAGFVVIDQHASVGGDVDAIRARGQREGVLGFNKHRAVDLAFESDDVAPPHRLALRKPQGKSLETRAPKGLHARASALSLKESIGDRGQP